jgi:hypothetical protein
VPSEASPARVRRSRARRGRYSSASHHRGAGRHQTLLDSALTRESVGRRNACSTSATRFAISTITEIMMVKPIRTG